MLLLLSSCGGGEADTPTAMVDSAANDSATNDSGTGTGGDASTADIATADTSTEDIGPVCPGGAGCDCKESSDCDSAMCIDTPAGKQCARTCVDTCPDAFTCTAVTSPGGDAVTICTPRWMRLCDPCTNSKSCPALALGKSACVSHGDAGAFCGTACEATSDCPSGFDCRDVSTVEGASSKLCTPSAGTSADEDAFGACACSPAANTAKLSTTCFAQQADGVTCSGARSCGEKGLGACIAKPPTAETCDGIDNDCDGETDEASCDDNNVCTSEVCAGEDGCAVKKLDDLPCNADDDACTAGDSCAKGVCVPGAAKSCDDKNPCTKDACMPATGCTQTNDDNVPCDDDNPCTLGDTCAAGGCLAGTPKVCKSGKDCIAAACNLVTGKCGFSNASTGKGCDDSDLCTSGDACDGGLCLGKKVTCDDADECTDDACMASAGCVFKPNTAACEDGNLCTLKDSCKGGKCGSGALKNCDDSNPCTADGCDVKTGVCSNDGTPLGGKACDADGSVCTQNDSCKAGKCTAGTAKKCDDSNPCTTDSCDAKTGCKNVATGAILCNADDKPCTVDDRCQSGVCTPGKVKDCGDINPCTADSCNAKTGACNNEGAQLENKGCDADANVCTENDSCKAGKCTAGTAKKCDDSNPCTTDSCDAKAGCKNVATGAILCNADDKPCTVDDRCQSGVCTPGKLKDCDDNNVCTADSCNPKTGDCVHDGGPLEKKGCDADGSQCTENDFCKAGKCTAGATKKCDDGNVCTTDGCDAKKGCTTASAGAILCNADNTPCTVDDRCLDGVCKQGKVKDCNDGNPCTKAVCWPSTGACNQGHVTDGTSCGKDGATCKTGKCQGGCPPKVKKVCYQNNIVWVDGCGKTGAISTACKANEFCSNVACVAGKFNANYLVTANPDTQALGVLGNAKFPPTLYTFVDNGDGTGYAQTNFGGKTYKYSGKLSGKTFDGNGAYTEAGSGLTIPHTVKLLWTFASTAPPSGKPLPDRFTGLIYDTLEVPFFGKMTLIWKVTGIRQ